MTCRWFICALIAGVCCGFYGMVVLILLSGCTMEGGDVTESDLNRIMTCTDTRDGEVFQFNTNSVRNIRRGFGAPSSSDITTLDGREMTLTSNMEAWLKCEKGPQLTKTEE